MCIGKIEKLRKGRFSWRRIVAVVHFAHLLGLSLQAVVSFLKDVLHYPLLLAMFGFNAVAVIPASIGVGIVYFGALWPVPVILFQAPAITLIAREAIRQMKSMPPSESFETSPERFVEALKEFVADVKKD